MTTPQYLTAMPGTKAMLAQVAAGLPLINKQILEVQDMIAAAEHAGVEVLSLRSQVRDLLRQHDRWVATLDAYGITHG